MPNKNNNLRVILTENYGDLDWIAIFAGRRFQQLVLEREESETPRENQLAERRVAPELNA